MTQPRRGFTVLSHDTAPEGSRDTLKKVEAGFGFVPNILGVAAESPAALKGYVALNQALKQDGAFTDAEREILLLAISTHNGCDYCVAAHTGNAERAGAEGEAIAALREGTDLSDPKLRALVTFARALIDKKGWLEDADLEAFLAAGYTRRHVFDVVAAVSMKTISNYVNHIADTPLDAPMRAKAWRKTG